MQVKAKPLSAEIPTEIPLPKSPLARVIAQVRFPPILSIAKPDRVADFQEVLRSSYPHLNKEEVQSIKRGADQVTHIDEEIIWRMADQEETATWRVSLGVDFVAIETSDYTSRTDFLSRLRAVVSNVEECFHPADTKRIGVRYIDQLKGDAVDRIGELIQPSVLGILQSDGASTKMLRDSTVHLMTQAQLQAKEGLIQGRWGSVQPNTTYDLNALPPVNEPTWVLDIDMFTLDTQPFESEGLNARAEVFAKRLYGVFRQMVTDEFLRFYGGKP